MQIETHFLYGSSAIHDLVYSMLHSKLPGDCQYNFFFFFLTIHMSFMQLWSPLPPSQYIYLLIAAIFRNETQGTDGTVVQKRGGFLASHCRILCFGREQMLQKKFVNNLR